MFFGSGFIEQGRIFEAIDSLIIIDLSKQMSVKLSRHLSTLNAEFGSRTNASSNGKPLGFNFSCPL